MKRLAFGASVLTLSLCCLGLSAAETKFDLTGSNTTIKFVGSKKDGGKEVQHPGGFKTVTGSATVDSADLTKAKIEVEIDIDSVYTDADGLTKHLKGPDFFNVSVNPKSKFVVKKLEKTGDSYTITGELTLNGVTKSVTFPAKVTATDSTFTLKSDFKINRHEIGITYGKGKIDDEVVLSLEVNAKK